MIFVQRHFARLFIMRDLVDANVAASFFVKLIRSSDWHPMKVVVVNGEPTEVVNKDDEMMKQVRSPCVFPLV